MSYYGRAKQLEDIRNALKQISHTVDVSIARLELKVAQVEGRLTALEKRIDDLAHALTLSITAPTDGATIRGSVTFSATASCPSAHTIKNVVFQIWDERAGWVTIFEDTASPYETTLDTTKYSNGSHKLRITSACVSGGASTKEITVTIDNTIPTGGTTTGGGTTGYGCVISISISSPPPGSSVPSSFTLSGYARSSVGHKITTVWAKRARDGATASGTVDETTGKFSIPLSMTAGQASDSFSIYCTCVNGESGITYVGYYNSEWQAQNPTAPPGGFGGIVPV